MKNSNLTIWFTSSRAFNIQLKVSCVLLFLCCLYSCGQQESLDFSKEWLLKDEIVASITEPSFPDRIYSIIDWGAIGDGRTMNTNAFMRAIQKCAEEGGGKVLVPSGKYLTAPIHLESNVNLYLEKGAEILFSKDHGDYPLVNTSYEGTELINFSPLIYAKGKSNIAITGEGVLNGQAGIENWWPWCGKDTYGWKKGQPKQHSSLEKLKNHMSVKGVPVDERVFGEGEYLRPTFIEPFECENVLIRGVTIINAPFWSIHPFRSNNVIVDGVTISSHGPNNDGCNPEYSKNVLIKNCTFNTGDDCIAIKSGRNEDGRRVNIKSENIVIQNCKMIDGHGGVVMGSEISAGVKNVFVENCEMNSPNLDRAIRIKSNTKRGGFVENVFVRNLKVGQVREAVLKINLFYGIYGAQKGDYMPEVKNIVLENVQAENGGKYGILIQGYDEKPIERVVLKDVIIQKADSSYSMKGITHVNFINTFINGQLMNNSINN
ncbi:polygalacturonase [Saonia flava]|uniref:Polygalacturonase n=1 Tax=Saonia flava TaxID=523696 RepID=A0A846R372_9FLAO|nr:glycoside hydrolase family 28 protein [Saonia flava]NJB71814.1 polygalacturonase [Saonia flava]